MLPLRVALEAALGCAAELPPGLRRALLAGEVGQLPANLADVVAMPLPALPARPLIEDLCHVLVHWGHAGRFPLEFHCYEHLRELPDVADVVARLGTADPLAVSCYGSLRDGDTDALQPLLEKLIDTIGVLGILRMLRVRYTTATLDAVGRLQCIPAERESLLAAFDVVYHGQLTVGAKALAKHCLRHSDGWWGGELQGSEGAKSAKATAIAKRILDGAAWLNIHLLPHDIPVFEVRLVEGFGARWVYEPLQSDDAGVRQWKMVFRGFLEPQMPDGHERGWKH